MKNSDYSSFTAKPDLTENSQEQILKQRTLALIGILNQDVPIEGVNHYEALRRVVQDNPELKKAHGGRVRTGEIITDAMKLYATLSSLDDKAGGLAAYEDIVKEASPERVYNDVVRVVLPRVIEKHAQQPSRGGFGL